MELMQYWFQTKLQFIHVVSHVKMMFARTNTLLYDSLALAGEVGEFVNLVKKKEYYPPPMIPEDIQEKMIDELSDVLFHVQAVCIHLEVPLEELMRHATEKNVRRYNLPKE